MINIDDLYNMNNIKKFPSKRNSVYLIENRDNLEIVKKFSDKEYYKKELIIFNILQKQKEYSGEYIDCIYKIPQLLDFNEEELLIRYQYIDGDTLLNSFEKYEEKNDIEAGIKLLNSLFQWIKKFQYALTKEENIDVLSLININLDSSIIFKGLEAVSLVDINFKNFIIKGNFLYGFDFENVSIEKKINDYARSLAYMMLYNPVGTEYKKAILPYLLDNLEELTNIQTDEIYKCYINEITKIEKRRSLKTNS